MSSSLTEIYYKSRDEIKELCIEKREKEIKCVITYVYREVSFVKGRKRKKCIRRL